MTAASFWALLQALPQILRLLQSVADYAAVAQGEETGRAEAMAEALTLAADHVDAATVARRAAEADHAAHPKDDTGFDPEFRRKD